MPLVKMIKGVAWVVTAQLQQRMAYLEAWQQRRTRDKWAGLHTSSQKARQVNKWFCARLRC